MTSERARFISINQCHSATVDRISYDLVSYSASSWSQHARCHHLIKISSSVKVTHRSLRHALPSLCNPLPTSLRIPRPNYAYLSQWPSFEHAGL